MLSLLALYLVNPAVPPGTYSLKELSNLLCNDNTKVEVTGASGGGMVSITLNGKGEMRKIKLDKSLVDPEEIEMLEDLILAAYNDARGKVESHVATEMAKVTGGLKLPPGMKLPF